MIYTCNLIQSVRLERKKPYSFMIIIKYVFLTPETNDSHTAFNLYNI